MQNIHLIIYKERILKQKHFKIEEKKKWKKQKLK